MKAKKSSKEQQEKNKISFLQELIQFAEAGIAVTLEGELQPLFEIADICMREEGEYMGDFILDNQGKLVEIRYDKINED